jgi:hypothetical protein
VFALPFAARQGLSIVRKKSSQHGFSFACIPPAPGEFGHFALQPMFIPASNNLASWQIEEFLKPACEPLKVGPGMPYVGP